MIFFRLGHCQSAGVTKAKDGRVTPCFITNHLIMPASFIHLLLAINLTLFSFIYARKFLNLKLSFLSKQGVAEFPAAISSDWSWWTDASRSKASTVDFSRGVLILKCVFKKACPNDSIINKFIKAIAHEMMQLSVAFFNLIFDTWVLTDITIMVIQIVRKTTDL